MTRDELRGDVENVRSFVNAPPTATVCPCCGARSIPQGLVLSPIKRRILNVVRQRPGIGAEALRDRIWAADPNGGPEDRKVLHAQVHQLNRLLRPHGIRIRGSVSGGYGVGTLRKRDMTEAELRQHLAPYAYDGTEAVEALIALMVSHSRPADPRRAIAKILERFRVDAVVSILDGGMS